MARTNLPISSAGILMAEGPLFAAPAAPVPTTATTGGTVLAGTYLVIVTYVTAAGETVGSGVGSIVTTGTTSTITIPSPTAAGAGYATGIAPSFYSPVGWNAYVTQLGGSTFTLQNATPNALGTNLVITAPPTSTGVNPPLTDPAGSTIDQANGMTVNLTSEAVPPLYDATRGVLLRVKNTAGSAANAIVRQGNYPPSMRAFLGDLVVAVPAAATVWIGPLDMARHVVQDTTVSPTASRLSVDFASGFTGTITAFVLPRNVPA